MKLNKYSVWCVFLMNSADLFHLPAIDLFIIYSAVIWKRLVWAPLKLQIDWSAGFREPSREAWRTPQRFGFKADATEAASRLEFKIRLMLSLNDQVTTTEQRDKICSHSKKQKAGSHFNANRDTKWLSGAQDAGRASQRDKALEIFCLLDCHY